MLKLAQVAVCYQTNAQHLYAVCAERTIVQCQTVGASRDRLALEG
jgi:hypothetical protein